ncbi:MAG TPA: M13 family metallopeptidase [Caulobacteraceae bacterium]|jgi:putative endopeptidase|nr:M13 family metallopeptidase [Caulobacteraceae bacterium]
MTRLSLCGFAALALFATTPLRAQEPSPPAGAPASAPNAPPKPDPAPMLTPPKFGTWGIDLAGRDTSVKPGDDFNRYANGKYLDALKIPADRTGYGVNYVLSELSENQVHAILEEEARKLPAGAVPATDGAKGAAFYKAFMDEGRINALGAKPLQPELAAIRAADTRVKLAALMGRGSQGFNASIFDVYIDADPKAPDRYVLNFVQGGLGLPDRDYYLQAAFADKKTKYQAYVARMLTMIGWPDPQAAARAVVAYETAIAQASWTRADRRDVEKTYNPMTVAQLAKFAPGFPWTTFLKAAEVPGLPKVIVNEKTAFPKISAVFARTPLPTLRAWAAFHLADSSAAYLSEPFVQARFEFRSRDLSGVEEQRLRWKRAVAAADGAMGEAIGRVYVERHFPPEAKAKIDALVTDLKTAMGARIQRLTWMSPATKKEALEKLANFTTKVGYPSKWKDYSALTVREDDLYGDMERSTAFEWRRQVKRINDPVDRTEWFMTPQTANAYYNSVMNEVVFPAAELQAPFFDPTADAAVNYGGIGMVIGHEITHGFDDEGRKTDGKGILRNWWTEEDAKKFEAAAKGLGTQYSSYEPVPGSHINGELTMGENIADLGGFLIALDAYHLSLKGQPAPVIDGLTGDQRFFLAYAQGWRDKRRDEAVKQQLVSDPHSPEAFRVNGVVRNIDAWYQAFDIKPGDKLYLKPEERARIW